MHELVHTHWKYLQAKDVAMYLERSEHLPLPGYGSVAVNPVPKATAASEDFKRRVRVRQELQNLQPVPVHLHPVQGERPQAAAGNEDAAPGPNGLKMIE